MNKKIGLIGVFIIGILALSFVSAAYGNFYYNARQGSQDVINLVVDFCEPFLQVLLGGQNWSGYLLFERLMLFLIIASITYASLAKADFFDNKSVLWIITITVPLLAVRWIDFEWLSYIIMQYAVLGVILTVILPFIIYLFFLHGVSHSSAFRRIAWGLYIAIYYGLWSTSSTGFVGDAYLWSIWVAVALIIFDPAIHRVMTKDEDLAPLRASINNSIAALDHQLHQVDTAAHISGPEKAKMKKYLEKEIFARQKELAKL